MGRLIDELAEFHSIAVVYLRATNESPMEGALVEQCAVVEEVQRRGALGDLARSVRLLKAWVMGDPMWVEDWRVPAFRDRLRRLVDHWEPDVVQFEFHTMAQYLDEAERSAKILVEHEPGAPAAKDRWRFSKGWRRLILARDMRAWERYERAMLVKFDEVVCFTDLDRRNLPLTGAGGADYRDSAARSRSAPLMKATPARSRGTRCCLRGISYIRPM